MRNVCTFAIVAGFLKIKRFVLRENALLGEVTGSRETASECVQSALKQHPLNLSYAFCKVHQGYSLCTLNKQTALTSFSVQLIAFILEKLEMAGMN